MHKPYYLDNRTTMGRWPAWLLLLLPLTWCFDREASTVQKVAGEQFAAPLCTNATKQNDTTDVITVITCRIRTQSGEECRMGYYHGRGFDHECGSRFRLIAENQTVFLRVTSLTTEDSGNYSCFCSQLTGTNHSQYNLTVEEKEDDLFVSPDESPDFTANLLITYVCCVTMFITVTGVLLGRCLRRSSRQVAYLPNTEPEEAVPHDTFVQIENALYSVTDMTQIAGTHI